MLASQPRRENRLLLGHVVVVVAVDVIAVVVLLFRFRCRSNWKTILSGLFLLGWRKQFSHEIDRFTLRSWKTFKKQFSHGEKTIEQANAIKLELLCELCMNPRL